MTPEHKGEDVRTITERSEEAAARQFLEETEGLDDDQAEEHCRARIWEVSK